MAAIFFVTIVEMIFTRGQIYGGNHAQVPRDVELGTKSEVSKDCNVADNHSGRSCCQSGEASVGGVEQVDFGVVGSRGDLCVSMSHGLRDATTDISNHGLSQNEKGGCNQVIGDPIVLTPEQIHKKALLQCVLLEIGILFHSVFIGMALSVTGGPAFIVLFLAIIFHRKNPPSPSFRFDL